MIPIHIWNYLITSHPHCNCVAILTVLIIICYLIFIYIILFTVFFKYLILIAIIILVINILLLCNIIFIFCLNYLINRIIILLLSLIHLLHIFTRGEVKRFLNQNLNFLKVKDIKISNLVLLIIMNLYF